MCFVDYSILKILVWVPTLVRWVWAVTIHISNSWLCLDANDGEGLRVVVVVHRDGAARPVRLHINDVLLAATIEDSRIEDCLRFVGNEAACDDVVRGGLIFSARPCVLVSGCCRLRATFMAA